MEENNSGKIKLWRTRTDVKCKKCENKGARKSFGTLDIKTGKISHTIGFGGTIPYQCLKCGEIGLIGFGNFECYEGIFEIVEEKEKNK